MFECMDDCIHLRACRRVQSIGKRLRLMVPRYCTEECSAYVGVDDVMQAVRYAVEFAFEEGLNGADWVSINDRQGKFLEWLRGNKEA